MATFALWRRGGIVWALCALLAVLSDVLFYGHPWGVNAAIFLAALYALMVLRAPSLWRTWRGRVWVVLVAAAIVGLIEEPSPLAMIMVVLGVGSTALLAERTLGKTFGDWVAHWMHLVVTMWFRWFIDTTLIGKWLYRHPRAQSRVGQMVRAVLWWVVPFFLGGVFLVLFALANPIIEKWVTDFFLWLRGLLHWIPELIRPGRMLLWGTVALGTYGLLRYRRMRIVRREVPAAAAAPAGPVLELWNGAGFIVRCLVVFNAIFLVQTCLDGVYLLGGATLPAGMTWKQYAHRGAYPLVATALLTGLFVLATFRTGGAAQRSAWARRLVYAWIVQNILLLFTTAWRLYLYVDVDGMTRLRISTVIWLGLVAAGFAWTIAKIVRNYPAAWLLRVNVLTALLVLYGCAFLNFDGWIAQYNVTHCREVAGDGPYLDMAYLRHLGPESLPALDWVAERAPAIRGKALQTAAPLREELASDLREWRGWTWRRARIARADAQYPAAARPEAVVLTLPDRGIEARVERW